jgi:hypothetical protein
MNVSGVDIESHVALIELLNNAQEYVDFGVFYFSLTGGKVYSRVYLVCTVKVTSDGSCDRCGWPNLIYSGMPEQGGQPGVDVYNAIIAAWKRGIKIRVVAVCPSCFSASCRWSNSPLLSHAERPD